MPKNAHSPTIHHAHISSPQLPLSQNPMTMHSKNILLHPNRSFQKTYEKPPTAAALSPFFTQMSPLTARKNLHIDQNPTTRPSKTSHHMPGSIPEIWLPEFAKKPEIEPRETTAHAKTHRILEAVWISSPGGRNPMRRDVAQPERGLGFPMIPLLAMTLDSGHGVAIP